MANEGVMHVDDLPHYEDMASLKKYIRSRPDKWDISTAHALDRELIQLSTGTAVEVENTDSIAISQIGRAEIAVKLGAGADEGTHNTVVFTLVYNDQDGVSHTCVATGTATLATTQVAFVPAIADFYAATSFTSSATFATEDVIVETSASTEVWATITATATAATEAQLLGTGAIYVRAHTNHADSLSKVVFGEYLSAYGTIKYFHGTTDGADGTTEVRIFEATRTLGVYAAITTTVKDFYRFRTLYTTTTPTTNSHEWLITDAACGNVDGSSGDIYGVILEGSVQWATSRYTPPVGYDAWIANIHANAAISATADAYILGHVHTHDQGQIEETVLHYFDRWTEWSHPELLEEMKDSYFTLADTAGASTCSIGFMIIEVKRI